MTDTNTLRRQADKAWEKAQYKEALDCFRALAQLEPLNKTHQMRIADCLLQLGQRDEAIGVYRSIAEDLAAKGNLVRAISVLKMILEIDPNEVETKHLLAALYSRQGVATVAARAGAAARAGVEQKEAVREVTSPEAVMGGLQWDFEPADLDSGSGLELDDGGVSTSEGVTYRPGAARPAAVQSPPELPELELSMDDAIVTETVNAAVEQTKDQLSKSLETDVNKILANVDDFPAVPPTPLFSDLEANQFERVIDMMTTTRVPAGMTVCREGDRATAMYVIADGKVRVVTNDAEGKTILLAELTEGDFFGEVALVEGGLRTATVEAVEDTELLVFSKENFDHVVAEFPTVRDVLRMFYLTRVADTQLAKSELFGSLTKEERWALVGVMKLWKFPPGAPIVRQGMTGGAMFVIRTGGARVFMGEGASRHVVGDLGPGDIFGEIAVVELSPRTATVVATADTQVFCLERDAARRAFALNPELGRKVKALIESRDR